MCLWTVRLWAERRLFVFDFAVKGTVVGFNTTRDGSKSFLKIQPVADAGKLQRDERPGVLEIALPAGNSKSLALHATVLVRGKGLVALRDWRNPRDGKTKPIANYRFEAETVEAVRAA